MKKYIVAIISFFDNEIKQFKVEAESEFEAAKKGMVEFTDEDYKQSEIDWQNSSEYPEDIDEMRSVYSEMDFSVMEVTGF